MQISNNNIIKINNQKIQRMRINGTEVYRYVEPKPQIILIHYGDIGDRIANDISQCMPSSYNIVTDDYSNDPVVLIEKLRGYANDLVANTPIIIICENLNIMNDIQNVLTDVKTVGLIPIIYPVDFNGYFNPDDFASAYLVAPQQDYNHLGDSIIDPMYIIYAADVSTPQQSYDYNITNNINNGQLPESIDSIYTTPNFGVTMDDIIAFLQSHTDATYINFCPMDDIINLWVQTINDIGIANNGVFKQVLYHSTQVNDINPVIRYAPDYYVIGEALLSLITTAKEGGAVENINLVELVYNEVI